MTGELIFISHATGDDAVVTRLHNALEGAGLDAWVDHLDITGGDNWNLEIQAALHARPYCVFVLSPESAANANCEAEWWHFLNQPDRRLYVALVAPVAAKAFPWRLKTEQYVDLSSDFDRGMKTLIAAIQGRRGLRPDDPAARAETRITGTFPYGDLDVPMSGREADLREVKRLLLEEGRRLVVLTATGGTGKTRLAVELAVTAAEFTGGVLWLRLNDKTTEDDLTAALRQHLNLPPTDPPDAVWAALAGARVLLVLDNAEGVPAAERAAIARRLEHYSTGGGARAVMTSREQWRECRHFNRAYPLERLSPEAAEQVARDMAKAQGYEALMQGREREFAEKAHYHPRLMKYAVGWLAENSLNVVLKMLEAHTGEDMQAVLEDVLHSTLRQIENSAGAGVVADFKRLLVCRGGFTEAAAEALTGAGSPSLGALRRWNLLQPDRKRYTPDLLAEAVLEPDESANPAHYDYYYALAQRHDKTQDYLGLAVESDNLAAAFDWAMRSGQPEKAFWLYNACSNFLANRGQFERMQAWLERAADALEGVEDAYLRGAVQNSLGLLYSQLPTGSRRENLKRAIGCYEAALVFYTAEAAPLAYAMTQNNLGVAYRELAELEARAVNLKRAIGCYEAALVFYTAEAAPLAYAMTQNNLGVAYSELAELEARAVNLKRAIGCYEAALVYRTAEAAPLAYAMTQNNLGVAYRELAELEARAVNLKRAIGCYEAALVFYTAEAAPLAYAMTQNNLGVAYSELAELEARAVNLKRAIGCYEAALVYRTAEAAPLAYAATQNNLGVAYRELAELEARAVNLKRAIGCYEAALVFYTAEAAPLAYAMTQNNLGTAYDDLGDSDKRDAAWSEAEKYFRLMGYIEYADRIKGWLSQ